jgi:hypothetical protein
MKENDDGDVFIIDHRHPTKVHKCVKKDTVPPKLIAKPQTGMQSQKQIAERRWDIFWKKYQDKNSDF